VHDVVADLHVVEDLGDRQRGRAGQPGGRQEAEPQQPAAGGLEGALGLDHVVDVLAVRVTEVGHHALPDLVELGAEGLELLGGHVRSLCGHGFPP
jgi:hypothetical protein